MEKVIMILTQVLVMLSSTFKSADSVVGIKETKEALIAGNEIGLLCCQRFSDGVQFDDFEAFYSKLTSDEEFKAKVKAGYDNYQAIPEEVKDIDVGEGCELASVQIEYVPKYIDSFKKQS